MITSACSCAPVWLAEQHPRKCCFSLLASDGDPVARKILKTFATWHRLASFWATELGALCEACAPLYESRSRKKRGLFTIST